jgi:very-short-patch-repair endonuclease
MVFTMGTEDTVNTKPKPQRQRSELEFVLQNQIKMLRLPPPVTEYQWHPYRKWRFDFAWPELKLAAEVEGGTWVAGRHNRGSGFAQDCEKYNAAALEGWRVFRFECKAIMNGCAVAILESALIKKGKTNEK